jgi:hypothetical protein
MIPWENTVGFTAEDRVKLSYHRDGFAQFSSESKGRIVSGRDPATGEPKGLGLFTNPLGSPIFSGPSVALTVWGIDDFAETIKSDQTIVFEPGDVYYRGCTPSDATSWVLQIYAFPSRVTPPLQFQDGCALLKVGFEQLNGPIYSVAQFKVVQLPKEEVFLGLLVSRVVTTFPAQSGWAISGPGDCTSARRGYALMAAYPRLGVPIDGRDPLDRIPPEISGQVPPT